MGFFVAKEIPMNRRRKHHNRGAHASFVGESSYGKAGFLAISWSICWLYGVHHLNLLSSLTWLDFLSFPLLCFKQQNKIEIDIEIDTEGDDDVQCRTKSKNFTFPPTSVHFEVESPYVQLSSLVQSINQSINFYSVCFRHHIRKTRQKEILFISPSLSLSLSVIGAHAYFFFLHFFFLLFFSYLFFRKSNWEWKESMS